MRIGVGYTGGSNPRTENFRIMNANSGPKCFYLPHHITGSRNVPGPTQPNPNSQPKRYDSRGQAIPYLLMPERPTCVV